MTNPVSLGNNLETTGYRTTRSQMIEGKSVRILVCWLQRRMEYQRTKWYVYPHIETLQVGDIF
jgi:hypothetical protein